MSPGHSAAPEEPGHATHGGGGKGAARAVAGSRAPSIPRCGVSSPFRGHLSTKSNAFCIGQTNRLSDQYRIRDHMLIHYNKILSAKAAVDCSVPKSRIQSVRYSDQQRREKMRKEVARLERPSSHSAAYSRPHSRYSADSVHRKDYDDPHSTVWRHSPYSDPGPSYSPSSFISSPRPLRSQGPTGKMQKQPPTFYRLHSSLSDAPAWTSTCNFQDNQTKTYSGDLLDKHSHHFTSKERPFTPRTLKTPAKSVLAQSRYYTPPRRKKREPAAAAETQTDLSSFRRISQTPERDSSPIRDLERTEADLLLSDDEDDRGAERLQGSLWSDLMSSSVRKINSQEEELAYLKFVADVTNEILTLGLFSDRVVERVFHRHLEENCHRLDEGKMRHLLDTLRCDLDGSAQSAVRTPWDEGSVSSSSWAEVMDGSCQEEEEAAALLRVVSDHHLCVDPAPDVEEDGDHSDGGCRATEHGDSALLDDAHDGDHPREHDAGGWLSPNHDGCDVEETAADDQTDQPSEEAVTSPSRHVCVPDVLEELQQSFADVVQVSQENDCGVCDLGEK